MRNLIFIFIVSLIATNLFSQVVEGEKKLKEQRTDNVNGWKIGGLIAINFSQTSLTNWAAGGLNSFAGNSLFSSFANYKFRKMTWDNSLDLGYGFLRQGKDDLRKTDDKIDFLSKYGRMAKKNWYFAGLLSFKTQMTPGYNYPNDSVYISKFFAPAYLLLAAGMDYKPSDNLNLFISPLTGKFTFVNDEKLSNAGSFGVEPAVYDNLGNIVIAGKKSRSEIGGYLRFFYKKELIENVTLQNKLDLFSNYLNNPQNIDINWEVLIAMKINKFITATIATHLIYDDDIMIDVDSNNDGIIDARGPRTQFKEVFAVGFSYKFNGGKK